MKTNNSKRFALLVAVSIMGGCASGPPSETVSRIADRGATLQQLTPGPGGTAPSVTRSAILMDSEVREQASLTEVSVDQIAIERAALFPSVSFGLTGGEGSASVGDSTLELSGNQTILDFGGTRRAIEAADIQLQIQYMTFQSSVDNAIVSSLLTYRRIQALEDGLAIQRAKLSALRSLQDLIDVRLEIGATGSSDALETRNRVERAEFDVLDAELELSEERDRLFRLTGQRQGGFIPNFPEICSPAGGETDDLKIAQLKVIEARLSLEEAERARFPRISLNPLGRVTAGSNGVTTGMNVSVSAPILEGGAVEARENAARNRYAGAEAAVETEERNAILDATSLQRDLSVLREKQVMLQRQIGLLEETRELYRSQYINLGTRVITDLLDMEESVYDRQAELNEVKYDLQKSLVQCAARSDTLRQHLGITAFQIYGYPLTSDGF
ncbi:TolC family protein [Lentibacter algarum]|uniref:TolC family protein n=1 Tax=Lentibacter algarum TaxID=576131 RepID=UPI001C067B41|nr:TolC family protein [Lentibacter algarum]MBU2982000.1 TolC family protein [Lentibacter algarum]